MSEKFSQQANIQRLRDGWGAASGGGGPDDACPYCRVTELEAELDEANKEIERMSGYAGPYLDEAMKLLRVLATAVRAQAAVDDY